MQYFLSVDISNQYFEAFCLPFVPYFRHEARQIYTYIGDVCVSVNPYTNLDIYGSEYVNQYKGEVFAHADSNMSR